MVTKKSELTQNSALVSEGNSLAELCIAADDDFGNVVYHYGTPLVFERYDRTIVRQYKNGNFEIVDTTAYHTNNCGQHHGYESVFGKTLWTEKSILNAIVKELRSLKFTKIKDQTFDGILNGGTAIVMKDIYGRKYRIAVEMWNDELKFKKCLPYYGNSGVSTVIRKENFCDSHENDGELYKQITAIEKKYTAIRDYRIDEHIKDCNRLIDFIKKYYDYAYLNEYEFASICRIFKSEMDNKAAFDNLEVELELEEYNFFWKIVNYEIQITKADLQLGEYRRCYLEMSNRLQKIDFCYDYLNSLKEHYQDILKGERFNKALYAYYASLIDDDLTELAKI